MTAPATAYQTLVQVVASETVNSGRRVTVTVGDDVAIALDRAQALEYAGVVHAAVAMTDYNLAFYRQMISHGMSETAAMDSARIFMGMQTQHLFTTVTWMGLQFGTTLGIHDDEARTPWAKVRVLLNGQPIEHWSIDYARGHVDQILAGVTEIDLDALYAAYLVEHHQTDETTAQSLVDELAEQRRSS